MIKYQETPLRCDPRIKLIVETIEMDEDLMGALLRGAFQESGKGIQLRPEQIKILAPDSRNAQDRYTPHLAIARVSEAELDTAKDVADDDGEPLDVFKLPHAEMFKRPDLLTPHAPLLWALEMELGLTNA